MNTQWINETKEQIFSHTPAGAGNAAVGEILPLDREMLFEEHSEWLLLYVESGTGTFHFADQYQGAAAGILVVRSFTDALCYRPHAFAGSSAVAAVIHVPLETMAGFLGEPVRNSMLRQAVPEESFALRLDEEEQETMRGLFREVAETEQVGLRAAALTEILARIEVALMTDRRNAIQEGLSAESETLGFDLGDSLFGRRWNPGWRSILWVVRRIRRTVLRWLHP